MPVVRFYNAGKLGIIRDIPVEELPPGAWSAGENVRFQDGKIQRSPGSTAVFGSLSTSAPRWVMPVHTNTSVLWVYSSGANLFATDGASHATVTRVSGGTYSSTDATLWTGEMFAGIPVITNGVDVPQYWASPGLGTDFANLANWPASTFCKAIKPYKNFLVALNVIKSGTSYGNLVKWSAPASPGAVPSSWDETNPATLAGEVELNDTSPGFLQDALGLRDSLILYKDNAVWGMQFIGGANIFRFYPIFSSTGILSNHCVKAIRKGTMHFVATGDDIIVHDGQNIDSILDKRWKRYLRNSISPTQYDRSFCLVNHANDEAWFCYASNSTWPNMAIVWNWVDNTLSTRSLEETSFIDTGPVAGGGDSWDTDSGTWDSDSGVWDALQFRTHFAQMVSINPNAAEAWLIDDPTAITYDGNNYTSFVERTGIALIGQDRVSGEFKADYSVRKICTRIWIKATGAAFSVYIGASESSEEDPIYETPQTFTPGTTRYLDFSANGKFIAVKFESTSGGAWEIEGYDLEIETVGAL